MRIKVGDFFLDQFTADDIAQTFEVNNLGKISTRSGSFSNNFKLPLTSNNLKILGYPSEFTTTNRDPYQKVDAEIISDSFQIGGFLKYKKTLNEELQCTFFGDNSSWINLVKNLTLKDLNLSRFNHAWDYNVIADRIVADPDDGYAYALVEYGEFINSTGITIDVEDTQMFPMVFLNTIVSQIYNDVGWRVEGELYDDQRFKRMVIPFSDTNFIASQEQIDASNTLYTPFATQTITTVLTNLNVGGTTNFLPTESGRYNVNIVVNINFATIISFEVLVLTFVFGGVSYTANYSTTGDKTVTLTATDVDIDIGVDVLNVQISSTPGTSCTVTGGSIEFKRVRELITSGDEIDLSGILPNIKQTDLLKYVFFSFGIIPQSNNKTKTVRLDFFKSIKENIANAVDWSGKLDLSSNISNDFTELLKDYSLNSLITLPNDDEDLVLKTYEEDNDEILGSGTLNIDNEFIPEEKTIYTSPFSPMTNVFRFNLNSTTNVVSMPNIPFYTEDGGVFSRTITPKPRIAVLSKNITIQDYVGGQGNSPPPTNWILNINESGGAGTRALTSMPFCWFSKVSINETLDDLTDSLAYELPDILGSIGIPMKDQYLQGYEDVLSEMKYLKAYFTLDDTDISSLDFTIPVYIERYKSYFYISKIKNYRGSTQSTQCELVKIS